MSETAAVLAFATIALVLMALDQRAQRRDWKAERSQLLDRLMARDLPEFKSYERVPEPAKPLTESERLAEAERDRIAEEAHGLV